MKATYPIVTRRLERKGQSLEGYLLEVVESRSDWGITHGVRVVSGRRVVVLWLGGSAWSKVSHVPRYHKFKIIRGSTYRGASGARLTTWDVWFETNDKLLLCSGGVWR